MGKFRFRLDTLLKMCKSVRDERRAELAQAYEADRVLQQRLARLSSDLQESRTQVRGASQAGAVDVDTLLAANRYELVLEAQRRQLQQQTDQLAAEIERRRELVAEADRQVRVLELLRDKKLDEHRRGESLAATKELDEVAARMHHRTLERMT